MYYKKAIGEKLTAKYLSS